MTLCIAAHCQEHGESRIVCCSDWMAGTDETSAETTNKQITLGNGWYGLPSGKLSRAQQLLSIFTKEFPSLNDPNSFFRSVEEIVNRQRERIRDEKVKHAFGRSYNWLLSEAHKTIPQESIKETLQECTTIALEAAIILAGYFPGLGPSIITVNEDRYDPYITVEENYSVIGTGAAIAESVLNRRKQEQETSLKRTLYNVLEAKRLSEGSRGGAPAVGAFTTLGVLLPNGTYMHISRLAQEILEDYYARYAPKEIPDDPSWEEIPPDFLVP